MVIVVQIHHHVGWHGTQLLVLRVVLWVCHDITLAGSVQGCRNLTLWLHGRQRDIQLIQTQLLAQFNEVFLHACSKSFLCNGSFHCTGDRSQLHSLLLRLERLYLSLQGGCLTCRETETHELLIHFFFRCGLLQTQLDR